MNAQSTSTSTSTSTRYPGHIIYKHKSTSECKKVTRVTVAETVTPEGYKQYRIRGFLLMACTDCGKGVYGHTIQGKISDKILCGAKCRSSKGPVCECTCGGEMHGSNY
jgi:hypothetical protein